MPIFSRTALTALNFALPAFLVAQSALAQITTVNGTIRSQLCVGRACSNDPTADFLDSTGSAIMLRGGRTQIDFEDTSTNGGSFPSNDWSLVANDFAENGESYFGFLDRTGGAMPFKVEAGAGQNSLVVNGNGNIGIGTSLAQTTVHIVEGTPTIRLNHVGAGSSTVFDLFADANGIGWRNRNIVGGIPFTMFRDAAHESLVVRGANIGLGTANPEEKLHIFTNATDIDAFALFDAAGSGSDAAFRLRQGTTNTTWEFRNQADSGRLNVGLAGGNTPFKIDNAANNNLLRLGRNGQPGEVNITGTLVVNNTALNVPDYVFADDYALRPLAEVQAFIDTNSHLPDVPSEAEIKANGVDMTEMQMTLLKKVEELTLYAIAQEATIAQLNKKAEENGAQAALIVSLQNRLDMLEATR